MQLKERTYVRLKSGTEGWIKGQVVEYTDIVSYPALRGAIYTGPGYKVYILEGKHKGETIRVSANYVEPLGEGPAKAKREPLYPHTPKKKEPLFPHLPKGQQVERLPAKAEEEELKHFWVEKNVPYDTWAIIEAWSGGLVRTPFTTKEEAIKREEEIADYFGYKVKEVPSPQEKFPEQYEVLKKLYPYDILQYHDDGDLTIQTLVPQPREKRAFKPGPKYVVTTDGEVFAHHTGEEALKKMGLLPSTVELLVKTEGDPRGYVRKFCCRICGECAPPDLLEEGEFLERISWLRHHYKERHPGMWGRR